MMGAMTAGAGATGARAWLAARLPPRVMKPVTVLLMVAGLAVAATLSGSGTG
jgi:hypothetical protein